MSYADVAEVKHGDPVNSLRQLWENILMLADDNGLGFASHADVSSGYPFGYAAAGRISPVHEQGVAANVGHILVVEIGDDVYQAIYLRRRYDLLYYRGKEIEIAFTGEDEKERTHSLEDYDDDHPYRVIVLDEVDGLAHGMLYCVRTKLSQGKDGINSPEDVRLDFAFERRL